MTRQISINTRMGWISAFENEGKIFRIKFGKLKKQKKVKYYKILKKMYFDFLIKKHQILKYLIK